MLRYEGRHFKRLARTGRLDSMSDGSQLFEIFHENSKLTPLSAPAVRAEIDLFNRAARLTAATRAPRKVHSLAEGVDLPATGPPDPALERVIAARRSARAFSGAAVTQPELARLLRYSYGVTQQRPGRRAVASAGALYPLEIYVVAWNVADLGPGVYHFDATRDRLDVVERGDPRPRLARCLWLDDVDAGSAALAVVITAFFVRSTLKFRDRGYRMILLEAGGVAQNLALVATALGLASCAVGSFLDNDLSTWLGADGFEEAALLPIIVGRPRPEAAAAAADKTAEKGT
jgi:SagB-type dehydrogenase family enzyme